LKERYHIIKKGLKIKESIMDVGVKGSSDSDGPAGSVGDGVDDFRPHPNN